MAPQERKKTAMRPILAYVISSTLTLAAMLLLFPWLSLLRAHSAGILAANATVLNILGKKARDDAENDKHRR